MVNDQSDDALVASLSQWRRDHGMPPPHDRLESLSRNHAKKLYL
jgi:hypothetical protein